MPSRPDKAGTEKLSWCVSTRYMELKAMKEWGLTPKQWRQAPKTDKLDMLAMCVVEAKMESEDNKVIENKPKRVSQESEFKSRSKPKWR